MLTALFVVARIVANPVSNVFQKQLTQRSANPLFIIGATDALLTLAALPLLFLGALPLHLGAGFWPNMIIAASLAVGSNALLVYALQSTGLSVLGPINAYKSVISLILGVFLLGEIPAPLGLAGVLLIVAGSYFVVDRDSKQPRTNAFALFFRERGIQFRFAALALSATEAIFLKKALLLSSPSSRSSSGRFSGCRSPPRRSCAGQAADRERRTGPPPSLAHVCPAGHHHRGDATNVAIDLRQAASRVLAGALSVVYFDQRIPGISLLPGGADSEAAGRIVDHGCRGCADCAPGSRRVTRNTATSANRFGRNSTLRWPARK